MAFYILVFVSTDPGCSRPWLKKLLLQWRLIKAEKVKGLKIRVLIPKWDTCVRCPNTKGHKHCRRQNECKPEDREGCVKCCLPDKSRLTTMNPLQL